MCNSLKCYPVHIKAPLLFSMHKWFHGIEFPEVINKIWINQKRGQEKMICVTPIWGPKKIYKRLQDMQKVLMNKKNKQDMITQ